MKRDVNKKTKALDDKSSAFFVLKTYIKKECLDKLLKMFDKESHAFRSFDFLHNFHQTNIYSCKKMKEENKKTPKDPYIDGFYLSSARKRDTFEKYKQIFDKLFDENILIEVYKQVGFKAATVKINPEYLSRELISLELPINYKESQNLTIKKDRKRFNRIYGNIRIGFDISEEKIISELLNDGKDNETIKNQLKIFRDIVFEGNLNGKKKRNSRINSKFHQLSKKITNWTTIDGKLTINLDQHATFFTILPRILTDNLYMVNENKELLEKIVKEIEQMREMIEETDDIYQLIADSVDTSREIIKEKMNAFICEKKTPKYLKEIYDFFQSVFPLSLQLLNRCRTLTDNYVSTTCMEIESEIFLGASLELSALGIPSYTKHDQIFIHPESRTIAENILKKRFDKQKVVYKVKIVDPMENVAPEVATASRFSLNSLNSSGFCTGKDKSRDMREEEEETGYYSPDFLSSGTKSSGTKSMSITTLKDGRYRVSIKNKKYNSKKNETKEEFYERLMNMTEISEENKKMIKPERSDFVREPSEIKNLTKEQEVVILEKPVEAVSGGDFEKTDSDTKKTEKHPGRACRGNSDEGYDIEMFKKMINGGL